MAKMVPARKIVVGMVREDAVRLLRAAGAKQTSIDGAPPTAVNRSGAAYELRGGELLIVVYDRKTAGASYRVSGLRSCQNADAPKSKRVWRTVAQLTL